MGTEEGCQEKPVLIEFLYKNRDLIDSLYSQLNQGNITRVIRNASTSDSSGKQFNGSIKLISGGLSTTESTTEGMQSDIDPHDYKVACLIESIQPEEGNEDTQDGNLVKITGSFQVLCKSFLKNIIEPMTTSGITNDLFAMPTGLTRSDGKRTHEVPMSDLFNALVDMLPEGTSGLVCKDDFECQCILHDQYFTMPIMSMVNLFGYRFSGDYTVIGILNTKREINADTIGALAGNKRFGAALYAIQDMPGAFLGISDSKKVITPLVIYRELSY